MKHIAALALLAAIVLSAGRAQEPSFTAPSAEEIATLLEFAGVVELTCRTATADDLARLPARRGVPLAAFSYSDPVRSSDTVSVTVYRAGSFRGDQRAKFDDWVTKAPAGGGGDTPAFGVFQSADGRSIPQFPLGFGPGGSSYGALLRCRDSRYELVLVQSTNFHDDEDPKAYLHHVSPQKELRSVIESIERLVFRDPTDVPGRH